jgi:hypothetical protein
MPGEQQSGEQNDDENADGNLVSPEGVDGLYHCEISSILQNH